MKLLLLLATTLFFYSQATEEKKCPIKEYVLTKNALDFTGILNECKKLEGELASEDLKDSDNAEKAISAYDTFRENNLGGIWLKIAVTDLNKPSSKTNPFIFSDGTEFDFDDSGFAFDVNDGEPNYAYDGIFKCLKFHGSGKLVSKDCRTLSYGLCKKYEKCEDEDEDESEDENEDEDSANSEFEPFRTNFPVFALFMACSVFKILYALVGIGF